MSHRPSHRPATYLTADELKLIKAIEFNQVASGTSGPRERKIAEIKRYLESKELEPPSRVVPMVNSRESVAQR
jgi:hypothetical protein